jgi:alpha-amylase
MNRSNLVALFFVVILTLIPIIPTTPFTTPPDQIPIYFKPYVLPKTVSQDVIPIGEGVMLQSFYWMTPDIGKWWNMLSDKLPEFNETGFDALWLPPPSKTDEGDAGTNGYEPYDYYDLGEFNQQGRVRTRYGTRAELETLISSANNYGIGAVADIVINHNEGGKSEFNPFLGYNSNTDFMDITSGKFPRNYSHFYPNDYGEGDAMAFASFPDLSHKHPYVRSELIKWGKWLRDEIGFDGWRFDVAAGIDADMLVDWMNEIGGWGVAEYWAGTYDDLTDYLDNGNETYAAFDFHMMYGLYHMAKSNGWYDMSSLRFNGLLWDGRINESVTFVKNHDTVREPNVHIDQNEHLAYAYILTHEGYPSVFWLDYFDLNLQPHLKSLIPIHNRYAKGSTQILFNNNDIYIMQRNGDPGLILGLNDNQNSWKEATVSTKWSDVTLTDLTGHADDIIVDSSGVATIKIPPNNYVIYSTGSKIRDIPSFPNYESPNLPSTVEFGEISIDGILDKDWSNVSYVDSPKDAGLDQRDLSNLYMKHDNENLYLGIGFGKKLWTEASVHYGIALDVREGGSREDPWLHSNIKWAGNYMPDYIYYLEANDESESWRELDSGLKFSYNKTEETWDSGLVLPPSQFASDSVLGFAELQIPLSEINFISGGNISIMVFSTTSSKLGAVDSIPQDRYTDGFGDIVSWLTMPEPIQMTISSEQSTTTKSTSAIQLLSSLFTLVTIITIRAKRRRDI